MIIQTTKLPAKVPYRWESHWSGWADKTYHTTIFLTLLLWRINLFLITDMVAFSAMAKYVCYHIFIFVIQWRSKSALLSPNQFIITLSVEVIYFSCIGLNLTLHFLFQMLLSPWRLFNLFWIIQFWKRWRLNMRISRLVYQMQAAGRRVANMILRI